MASKPPEVAQVNDEQWRKDTETRKRQARKAEGLCKSCPNKAIPNQTRCPDCAEKHRVWNQRHSEKRRRAQGTKPRPNIDDAELVELVREEIANAEPTRAPKRVCSETYQQKKREDKAKVRAERISFGLCVG